MNSIFKTIGAVVAVGAIALTAVSPALAAPQHRFHQGGYHQRYHGNYFRHGPVYRPYYHSYYNSYPGYYYDPGYGIATGIIGGIAGAIVGSAVSHGGSHVWRCEHTYRTYRPATNTYTGNDGKAHICRL